MPNSSKVIISLFVVILGLVLWIILSKPNPITVIDPNIRILKDSVNILKLQASKEADRATILENKIIELNSLPPIIKYVYIKQKQQVPGFTATQLDSTIRSITGLRQH